MNDGTPRRSGSRTTTGSRSTTTTASCARGPWSPPAFRGASASSTTRPSGRSGCRSRRCGANRRAGGHNSLTRVRLKPVLMIGGYGQFTYHFNYWGPTGVNRDTSVRIRKLARGGVLRRDAMDVRAQVSMVFHLDKCIGCHTCSIACKNVWTDRKGAEYMWWNNVETKPGTGYPTSWEDQEKYKGGWQKVDGRPRAAGGGQGARGDDRVPQPEPPAPSTTTTSRSPTGTRTSSTPRRGRTSPPRGRSR